MENNKNNSFSNYEKEMSFEELETPLYMEEWKHIMYYENEYGIYDRIPSQPSFGDIILKVA